jgi:hypothetical protein
VGSPFEDYGLHIFRGASFGFYYVFFLLLFGRQLDFNGVYLDYLLGHPVVIVLFVHSVSVRLYLPIGLVRLQIDCVVFIDEVLFFLALLILTYQFWWVWLILTIIVKVFIVFTYRCQQLNTALIVLRLNLWLLNLLKLLYFSLFRGWIGGVRLASRLLSSIIVSIFAVVPLCLYLLVDIVEHALTALMELLAAWTEHPCDNHSVAELLLQDLLGRLVFDLLPLEDNLVQLLVYLMEVVEALLLGGRDDLILLEAHRLLVVVHEWRNHHA